MSKKVFSLVIVVVIVLGVVIFFARKTGTMDLILSNALAFGEDIPDSGWKGKSYEHLPYSEESESDYLDLYVPQSTEKMPLIVLVHGGGFVENDSQCRQAVLMYQYFRSKGYACASVNYRLATEAPYPAAVEDVKAAVRFLYANAETYGYDKERIAIWGESAGGYLAAMAALSGDDEYRGVKYIGEEEDSSVTVDISALILFYGVYEFDRLDQDFQQLGTPEWLLSLSGVKDTTTKEDSVVALFAGSAINSLSEEKLQEMSPTARMNEEFQNKKLKIYMTHGSADITVPKLQSIRLYEQCAEILGEEQVVYREMKDYKHADDRFYLPEHLDTIRNFLSVSWE